MTKVDLITGFLGAGKTTFIRKYADFLASRGEKVHIIENEFGGISIDARTLKKEHRDVSQITGGCICCTAKLSFQGLLTDAARAGFDRILVEPSGIYDASRFLDSLMLPEIQACCQVGNMITIVDSCPDNMLSPEARYLLYSQIANTGCMVMSKTQLRKPEQIEGAKEALRGILEEFGGGRESQLITKPWDQLTEADMEAISTCGCHPGPQAYRAMDHASLFYTAILAEKFDTLENLRGILDKLLHTREYGEIYRIKGFIEDVNGKWYSLSCSPSGCFVKEADVKRGAFLVIGQNFDDQVIRKLFIPRR